MPHEGKTIATTRRMLLGGVMRDFTEKPQRETFEIVD